MMAGASRPPMAEAQIQPGARGRSGAAVCSICPAQDPGSKSSSASAWAWFANVTEYAMLPAGGWPDDHLESVSPWCGTVPGLGCAGVGRAGDDLAEPDVPAGLRCLVYQAKHAIVGFRGKGGEMTETGPVPPGVDPARPSPARLYDYFLGGTANFAVDRAAAEKLKAAAPEVVDGMWANRGFHGRAAVWMAEQGIRQFIDIGSGLPTQNNTHQAVHKVAADARVVYVDNDPMVAAHADALLAEDGTTTVITADVKHPDALLGHPALVKLVDFAEPAGVLMTSVVHFVPDEMDPWGLVARYMAAVAPGSYLALSHGTYDNMPPLAVQASLETYARSTEPVYLRPRAEVERFFDGLELVEPYTGAGPVVTYAGLWAAEDPVAADTDGSRGYYCGVARRSSFPARGGSAPGATGGLR